MNGASSWFSVKCGALWRWLHRNFQMSIPRFLVKYRKILCDHCEICRDLSLFSNLLLQTLSFKAQNSLRVCLNIRVSEIDFLVTLSNRRWAKAQENWSRKYTFLAKDLASTAIVQSSFSSIISSVRLLIEFSIWKFELQENHRMSQIRIKKITGSAQQRGIDEHFEQQRTIILGKQN